MKNNNNTLLTLKAKNIAILLLFLVVKSLPVEFERPIVWKYFSLEIYLEKIFGRKIDLVTKNALEEQIKDSILNQVKYVSGEKTRA